MRLGPGRTAVYGNPFLPLRKLHPGSLKQRGVGQKSEKMTLNLNSAETVRPSEMMPKGQNQNKTNMRGGLAPRATDIVTSQITK